MLPGLQYRKQERRGWKLENMIWSFIKIIQREKLFHSHSIINMSQPIASPHRCTTSFKFTSSQQANKLVHCQILCRMDILLCPCQKTQFWFVLSEGYMICSLASRANSETTSYCNFCSSHWAQMNGRHVLGEGNTKWTTVLSRQLNFSVGNVVLNR